MRAIFRLRAMILGAKGPGTDWSRGLVEELLRMGWGILAEEKDRWLLARAQLDFGGNLRYDLCVAQAWTSVVTYTTRG